jgi:hypothetical protein
MVKRKQTIQWSKEEQTIQWSKENRQYNGQKKTDNTMVKRKQTTVLSVFF